jgi:hypothetical protein
VRIGDGLEPVPRIDHRPQRARLEQRQHLGREPLAQRDLLLDRSGRAVWSRSR